MSVSYCLHHALAIAKTPADTWGDQIKQIPECCEHSDCGEPRNCRERNAEYLRMQYRINRSRVERPRAAA